VTSRKQLAETFLPTRRPETGPQFEALITTDQRSACQI
jgi:hypothetical protein